MQFTGNSIEFTWIAGNSVPDVPGNYGNYPGGRHYALGWTSSDNNLYIMGGMGLGNSSLTTMDPKIDLSDFWKFNLNSNTWEWISGSQSGYMDVSSVYPGTRISSATWVDATGNLWLCGGTGYSNGVLGDIGDLWSFDITLKQWTLKNSK